MFPLLSFFETKEGRQEGKKEMFYLKTHSIHFYLLLCGVRHMVKDHSYSERGNPLPPTWATLSD